jgi:tetratricopeptide (TPR) repeat protein
MIKSRKKFTVILTLLILSFGGSYVFGKDNLKQEQNKLIQNYRQAKNYFEKGLEQFLKGNYNKVEKNLKKSIEIFPDYANAYYYLSKAFYKKNNIQKALESIENAKKTFKKFSKILIDASRQNLGILTDNIKDLRSQLELQAWSGRRQQLYAQMIDTRNKIDLLRGKMEGFSGLMKRQRAEYSYFHGNIYFKLKKFQEAHRNYVEAIKIDPAHGQAYNNIAILYYSSKRYKEALNYMNLAQTNGVKINPKFKKAIENAIKN